MDPSSLALALAFCSQINKEASGSLTAVPLQSSQRIEQPALSKSLKESDALEVRLKEREDAKVPEQESGLIEIEDTK